MPPDPGPTSPRPPPPPSLPRAAPGAGRRRSPRLWSSVAARARPAAIAAASPPPELPSASGPATPGCGALEAPARAAAAEHGRRRRGFGVAPIGPVVLDRQPGPHGTGEDRGETPTFSAVPPRRRPPRRRRRPPAAGDARFGAVLDQHAQQRQRDHQPETVAERLAGAVDRLAGGAAAQPRAAAISSWLSPSSSRITIAARCGSGRSPQPPHQLRDLLAPLGLLGGRAAAADRASTSSAESGGRSRRSLSAVLRTIR